MNTTTASIQHYESVLDKQYIRNRIKQLRSHYDNDGETALRHAVYLESHITPIIRGREMPSIDAWILRAGTFSIQHGDDETRVSWKRPRVDDELVKYIRRQATQMFTDNDRCWNFDTDRWGQFSSTMSDFTEEPLIEGFKAGTLPA